MVSASFHCLIPRWLSGFRNKTFRSILYSMFFVCILITSIMMFVYLREKSFFYQYYILLKQTNTSTLGYCQLPVVDPWDDRVKPYFHKLSEIECGKVQPMLTEVLDNGVLKWNHTELREMDLDPQYIECKYQTFRKSNCNDDILDMDNPRTFTGQVELKDQFVTISCRRKTEVTDFYNNVHFWVPKFAALSSNSTSISEYPNVLIFVIDSMSQANLIRQMPKTYRTFMETLEGHLLSGVVKVGKNTYPNIVPMLTGRRPYFPEDGLPPANPFFDDWPLIWKIFSQKGYVTALAEDEPQINLFNYLTKGFCKQPTDYYMRPFWLAQKQSPLRKYSKNWCFGNVPNHYLLLSWMYKVQNTLINQKRPFFLMSLFNEITHDDLNTPQLADIAIARFLQNLHDSGNLNNTIMFLLGDHGLRFGNYRTTLLGRIEGCMPFLAIHLPRWLKTKHPHLISNLQTNKRRLTTWFDIHDTLWDIIYERWDHPRRQWSRFGYSVWYQLPENRTCTEIGIPSNYCPCEEEFNVSISSVEVQQAAEILMKYINAMISPYPLCEPLEIKTVHTAKQVRPSASVAVPRGFKLILRLIVEVSPSNAIFESRFMADAWSSGLAVVDDIERINAYGNQSWCVAERTIKHICFCGPRAYNTLLN